MRLAEAALDERSDPSTYLEGWGVLGDAGRLLPVFLPLLPFARHLVQQGDHPGNADDLWNYLAVTLEAQGRYEGLAAAVHAELEAGRVLLLLDGLDEVAGGNSRQQVVQAVQAFAREYAACRIVVTCRVRAYAGEHNQAWQLPGWETATLADWTVGQMQHFVAAWYGAAAVSGGMGTEPTTAAGSGDTINAQGLQGFVNRPSGPVRQHFGDTISGDFNVSGVSGTGLAIGHKAQAQVGGAGGACVRGLVSYRRR